MLHFPCFFQQIHTPALLAEFFKTPCSSRETNKRKEGRFIVPVSITGKASPRKIKHTARRKKIANIVIALMATVSMGTWAEAEAADRLPANIAAIEEQTGETVANGAAQGNDTATAEKDPFQKSIRTGKDRIWINPSQAKKGREAPLFIALCFHEIRDDRPKDDMAVSCSNFRAIVRELKSQGFWFLDSNDIIAIKHGKMRQPAKSVFLSFDDGYEDNYTNAFPIIQEENIKATFFLPTDFIGKPNRMNVNQLKEMAAYGMCFGSHTVTHKQLDKLSNNRIKAEMNDSKYVLQHDYGIKVESIAYPCGFQSKLTLQQAAKNYEIAFTANMDSSIPDTFYTIHRYGVFRWNTSLDSILNDPHLGQQIPGPASDKTAKGSAS